MRRALTSLGLLFAAAPLMAATTQPATAATGTVALRADGTLVVTFVNPKPGCYELPEFSLLSRVSLDNKTDADVVLHSGAGCKRGLLRAATRVRAGATRERTLTGTYSLSVRPGPLIVSAPAPRP
ncbi:hypothetical protein GCM10009677_57060 [Sphaerisporangium rubeum]|uniref:Uncharacterized protein n=1 Tax=Sphaerisporangium rubeum TaxID=321317 RepID=A0A7X0M728_9ACTN|nr:hypothetical protein [Sphaerisporangium rubeum]MBB6474095.1 hypothetical protein [Sphaerisporangium rubeum]